MRGFSLLFGALAATSCQQPSDSGPIGSLLTASERGAIEVAVIASRLAEESACLSREVSERRREGLPGMMLLLNPPRGFEPLVEARTESVVHLDGQEIAGVQICNTDDMHSPRVAMPVIIGDRALVVLERGFARTAYWMVRRNQGWLVAQADLKVDDI
jgi:hypothetical protein